MFLFLFIIDIVSIVFFEFYVKNIFYYELCKDNKLMVYSLDLFVVLFFCFILCFLILVVLVFKIKKLDIFI